MFWRPIKYRRYIFNGSAPHSPRLLPNDHVSWRSGTYIWAGPGWRSGGATAAGPWRAWARARATIPGADVSRRAPAPATKAGAEGIFLSGGSFGGSLGGSFGWSCGGGLGGGSGTSTLRRYLHFHTSNTSDIAMVITTQKEFYYGTTAVG